MRSRNTQTNLFLAFSATMLTSALFLFRSAARHAGPDAIGIIMTGMGDDGAKGLLEMRQAGAYTIAQVEDSSVVFGMPRVAIGIGAAQIVLPLDKMAGHVCRKFMQQE